MIFDVDGTLTTTSSGETFRKTADDWQWLPGRLEKLRELDRQGAKLAIATNQGGVAFGYLDPDEMRAELSKMAEEAHIPYIAMCFLHPKAKIARPASLVLGCSLILSLHQVKTKRMLL